MPHETIDEGERQFGECAHIEIDHRELFIATNRCRQPEEPEAGIVDHDLGFRTEHQ
jgi:hypothetical protein